MIRIKTTVRDRRIEVRAPSGIPDGTEIILTIGESKSEEDEPVSPEEIARVLAAMKELEPLDIPQDVAADLDAWERKVNQYGIDHKDQSMEDVFP